MLESRRRPGWILFPLFVLSGASGLCFEILWARQLQVVLGATSKAIAGVVSLFMLGLALGGTLGARWAIRVRRPARAYGAAELGIGLCAAVVTVVLPHLEGVGSVGLRYLVAALCLVLPSTLMGLTFPLVMQACDPGGRGGGGGLYAANTAGATLGCMLAGFLGIGGLGIRATAGIAAAGNLLCGLTALLFFRRVVAAAYHAPIDGTAPEPSAETDPRVRPLVFAAAGMAGASALGAEILWTRVLVPCVNSSSYAFSAILATYLAGLALGATWVARRCVRLSSFQMARLFGLLQLGLVVLVWATPRLLRVAETLVPGYVGIRQITSLAGGLAMMAGVFAKAAIVVLVPTFLMGASLPLCIAQVARTGLAGGAAAGRVVALNTVGGVAGSVLAGFALLPGLGSGKALLVVGLGNFVAALLLLVPKTPRGSRRLATLALTAVLVLLLLVIGHADAPPFLGRLAQGAQPLLVDEGPQDTTAVIEQGPPGRRNRTILSNGVSYAGDAPAAQRYMGLLGHLPVLLSDDAAQSLVICVGTGTTAANLATHDEVRQIDLVDISPAVHKTLPLFAHVNHSVWNDARVRMHEADGRQFVTRTPQNYGVITLEPPPPRAAGAASLYTIGFYERARASLRPGGVIAQWLPLHGLTEAEILMLARTFLTVFPEAALFLLNPDEAALLGSPSPLVFDVDRVRRRLESPAVRAALARIGFATDDTSHLAADLLALAPVSGPALRELVGDGPVVTDDRPLIEQFGFILATDASWRLDPDGRRGLLRRLADRPAPALPSRGAALPDLTAARETLRSRILAWLAQVERTPAAGGRRLY
ncbi:MAG TPA: fused MFS/spermidine synthase [Polyangia bacterium]|nr:fused MFS/spermidine synthase [Polyangia bacterium]